MIMKKLTFLALIAAAAAGTAAYLALKKRNDEECCHYDAGKMEEDDICCCNDCNVCGVCDDNLDVQIPDSEEEKQADEVVEEVKAEDAEPATETEAPAENAE